MNDSQSLIGRVFIMDKFERQTKVLIHAAIDVISRKGFEKATVSEIVNKAGVAQGTFYNYFENKNDILKTLAQKLKTEVEEKIEREVNENNSPEEKIQSALKAAFDVYKNYEKIAAPLYSGTAHLEFQKYSKEVGQAFVDRLAGWIQEGKKLGTFKVTDPELNARFIISLYERVAYSCLLSLYPSDFEEIFPHFVTFIDQALGIKK